MKSELVITEEELPPEVMRAIKDGQKLVAIKLLREATGIGLANAKVLIDRASTKHAPRPPRQTVMKDYRPINMRLVTTLLFLAAGYFAFKVFIVQ